MNELVFIQVGMTKADTLMKYEPEQSCEAFDEKARGFVKLYLLKDSALNSFARLVLTEGIGDGINLVWERIGTSARYVKYRAIENEHMPAKWGWNERAINMLYILKGHPINVPNNGDALYLSAQWGGAVEPTPERAVKKADKTLKKNNEELRIRATYLEGMKLAKAAAQKREAELKEQGAKFAVKDVATGIVHGTMLDDSGGAWIVGVDGRKKFGRVWKSLSRRSDSGFFYGDKLQSGINVTASQYVSVQKAAAEAFVAHVNSVLGTKLYVTTYLN